MSSGRSVEKREYFLKKGYIYLPHHPTLISTVLGSGVSVCLWDRRRKQGGMNYFLYPYTDDPEMATPLYGNVSTIALIRFFREDGSEIKDVEAQIFGGAHPHGVSEEGARLAADNVDVARRVLRRYGIPVVAEDAGGRKGRKIVFDTFTSEVAVIHVDRIRQEDWYPYQGER